MDVKMNKKEIQKRVNDAFNPLISYYAEEIQKRDDAIRHKESAFFNLRSMVKLVSRDCLVYQGIAEIDLIRKRLDYILETNETT